jgi:hypothetical protein
MQSQGLIGGSDNVPNWRFVGEQDDDEEVYWNFLTSRWEVRIVICDTFGTIEDYGFDPTEPDLPIDEDLINGILNRTNQEVINEGITPTEEPKSGLTKGEIEIRKQELDQEDKRIKLEEAKSKRKDKLMEKYLDGKIDDKTFLEMLKLI